MANPVENVLSSLRQQASGFCALLMSSRGVILCGYAEMILDGVTPDLAARTESLSHAAARTRGARTRARLD